MRKTKLLASFLSLTLGLTSFAVLPMTVSAESGSISEDEDEELEYLNEIVQTILRYVKEKDDGMSSFFVVTFVVFEMSFEMFVLLLNLHVLL